MNYYNEFDPSAASWLRELIAQGLIPAGDVDERSITEISPNELSRYTQCHFFAGIGGWPLALELAGWDPARPVWTGSCPCQPYSAAGKGLGDDDPRNLWPAFFKLIRKCRPVTVFGEQVADAIGKGWLDGVSANMEAEGYACGAVVLGAHSVLAPHIRQRLYWVADSLGEGLQGHGGNERDGSEPGRLDPLAAGSTPAGGPALRVANSQRYDRRPDQSERGPEGRAADGRTGGGDDADRLGLTHGDGRQPGDQSTPPARHGNPFEPAGFWDDSRWIHCRDGKHRRIPTQSALFPLADGLPYKLARRGSIRPALLKGAGNAIVPQTAASFIQAFLEVTTPNLTTNDNNNKTA